MFYKITSAWSWWWNSSYVIDEIARLVLTALTPLCILWFMIFFMNRKNKGSPLPPGPRGLPILGYLPFLGSDLRLTFKHLADTYGPIFKIRLGIKPVTVITSPSLAKEVLRDQDVTFANRNPTVTSRLATFGASDVVFSDYGPEWRNLKKIFVRELMSNSSLNASYYRRKELVQMMINQAYKKAGEPVDVSELLFVTVMCSIMSMVWGDTVKGNEGSDTAAAFRAVIAEFIQTLGTPNISDYLPFLARFDLQGIERRMMLICIQIEELFDAAISHRHSGEKSKQQDFLGYLLQLTKQEDRENSLTLPQVKAMLTDSVVGGMDTTATTIEWTMAELLQHPTAMRNVQEELAKTVGLNNAVEDTHLPNLKYLRAALRETLRLHPVVPFLVPHCPSMSTTLGGYTIARGSQVFINAWAIQRDPKLWDDPLTFKPERFLSGSATENLDFLGTHLQYIPFGSGRRMCPGVPLAEKTSLHVLASLLHAFEWTLPNGSKEVDLSETFGIVVKKTKPLIAVPSPRLSGSDLYSCKS